jgi:hypothetical protein
MDWLGEIRYHNIANQKEHHRQFGTNGNNGTNGRMKLSVCSVVSVCSVFLSFRPDLKAKFGKKFVPILPGLV